MRLLLEKAYFDFRHTQVRKTGGQHERQEEALIDLL